MFEEIVRVARRSDYDFRMTACPSDPLARRFDEWINYYKLKWAISRILKPDAILEIGVRFGYAAAAFLDAYPSARYVGVDPDVDGHGGVKGALKWARTITQQFEADFVIADSQSFDRLPGGIYDLVHMIGNADFAGRALCCIGRQGSIASIVERSCYVGRHQRPCGFVGSIMNPLHCTSNLE